MQRNKRKVQKRKPRNAQKSTEQARLTYGPGSLRTRMPVAPSLTVTLKYMDPQWMYGNYGNFIWSTRFRMNSVYDPDPHTSSGGVISYFTEYAALYTRYRVLEFRYDVEFANNMAEPIICTVAPSKEDLGDNYIHLEELSEVNQGRSAMAGQAGSQNRCRFRGKINLATYSGFPGYLVDDTTSSRVNTNPAIQFYLNMGFSSNVLQAANSCGVRSFFYYKVIFYEPKVETAAVAARHLELQTESDEPGQVKNTEVASKSGSTGAFAPSFSTPSSTLPTSQVQGLRRQATGPRPRV